MQNKILTELHVEHIQAYINEVLSETLECPYAAVFVKEGNREITTVQYDIDDADEDIQKDISQRVSALKSDLIFIFHPSRMYKKDTVEILDGVEEAEDINLEEFEECSCMVLMCNPTDPESENRIWAALLTHDDNKIEIGYWNEFDFDTLIRVLEE